MPPWLRDLLNECRALAEAGAYDEVVATAEAALAEPDVTRDDRDQLENTLAWALAHVEEAERAVALARAVVARTPPASAHRPYTLGTFGGALVAAGRYVEALEALGDEAERGVAANGDAWAVSAQRYYRAVALAALGRHDEALETWRAARDVDPTGLHGQRADRRLRELELSGPYRGPDEGAA